MASATLGTPSFKLGNWASTPSPEEQNGPPIRRRHLSQLSPQALVIRVPLAASLPGQLINLLGSIFDAVLCLKLQIEFQSFLQSFTARFITFSGARATAELHGNKGNGKEQSTTQNVGDKGEGKREIGGEQWGEEEGEGVEDVGEVRREEEGTRKENKEEDQEV
ncbi:hypothetical protein SLA2020_211840 [Shorea laevis]